MLEAVEGGWPEKLGTLLLHPYFATFHRLCWSGTEELPPRGPAILAANHQSYFDPVAIGLAARRRINYLALEAYYRAPVLGRCMRLFDTVPVSEHEPSPGALGRMLAALEAGGFVGIFPEGGRTPDGLITKPREGVAVLALRTRAPVVPVTISGAWAAWPKGRMLPRPAPIALHFGRPMRFGGRSTQQRRREVTYRVMLAVAEGFRRLGRPELAARSEQRLRRWREG